MKTYLQTIKIAWRFLVRIAKSLGDIAWRFLVMMAKLLLLPVIIAMIHGVYIIGYMLIDRYFGFEASLCLDPTLIGCLEFEVGNHLESMTYAAVVGLLAWLLMLYDDVVRNIFNRLKRVQWGPFAADLYTPSDARRALFCKSNPYHYMEDVLQDAGSGKALAQNILGLELFIGESIKRNRSKAVFWWRKAAEQGLTDAQHNLGWAYHEGAGIGRNDGKAIVLWTKAAGNGCAKSQFSLGNAYCRGKGVDKNHKEAVRLWYKAAEQGLPDGQYHLGLAYRKGEGVDEDAGEAFFWLRKAAEQGLVSAQTSLGLAYYKGRGVDKSFKEAVKWWRIAAEQGHAWGQNNLGWAYNKGEGVDENASEAAWWYRKAAEQGLSGGSTEAQHDLGLLHARGLGVPQSCMEAYIWLSIANTAVRREESATVIAEMANQLNADKSLEAAKNEVAKRSYDIRCREAGRMAKECAHGLFSKTDYIGEPYEDRG